MPRIVLYSRVGCHLCDDARALVAQVAAETGEAFSEVDVDAAGGDGDLAVRYGELVPVVEVDGVRQGYWRIDAARLRRALATPVRGARPQGSHPGRTAGEQPR
ncbi:glutaredoxin family protein [Cellulomonas composti]|uniref:Thioredoxin family protein n=1 Tax=Cellulomonas composti TaxID=266130 RepID=A0A511JEE5_9CELL|nr:glutaredoxin family protein [Cellulomonas composti]GEL96364.1 thioredoxin family protein [Cellulomonas composti]